MFSKVKEIQGHAGAIYALDYSNDFPYTGGADRFVTRWQVDAGNQDNFAIKFPQAVYSLRLVGSNFLAVGLASGSIHIFDLEAKKEIHHFTVHQSAVFGLSYSKKINRLYASDADGNLSVWDAKDFKLVITLPLDTRKIRHIALNEEESVVGLSCQDGKLRLIDAENFNEIARLEGHEGGCNTSLFCGEKIISGAKDARLRIWDLNTFECKEIVPAHNYAVYDLVRVGDNVISASRDKTIKVWDLNLQFLKRLDRKEGGHQHSVNKLIPDGNDGFYSISDDRRLIYWRKG